MAESAVSRKRVDEAAAALAALPAAEREAKAAAAAANSAKVFDQYSAAVSKQAKDPEILAHARKSPFALTEAKGYVHDQAYVDSAKAAAAEAYTVRNLGSRWGAEEVAKVAAQPVAPASAAPPKLSVKAAPAAASVAASAPPPAKADSVGQSEKGAEALAEAMAESAVSRKRVDEAAAALAALPAAEREAKAAAAAANSAKVFDQYSAAVSKQAKDPEILAHARKSPFALTEAKGYVHDQAYVDSAKAAAAEAYTVRNLGSRWGAEEVAKVAAQPAAPASKSPYVKEEGVSAASAEEMRAQREIASTAYSNRDIEALGSRWGSSEVERIAKECSPDASDGAAFTGKNPDILANARKSPFALTEVEGYVADPAKDAANAAAAAEAYANRDAKTLSSRWGEEEVARVTALPSKPDAWAMEYADAALSKLDELEVKYSSKTDT